MTVEECVNDAITLGGYQFAGLTAGGSCFFADNETAGAQSTSQSNCLSACPGDNSEACGGSGNILIYTDSSWVIEDAQELADDLEQLEDALNTLQQDVNTWTSDLKQYQASLPSSSSRLRRAMQYSGRLLSRSVGVTARDSSLFDAVVNQQRIVIKTDIPRVKNLLTPQRGKFKRSARYQRVCNLEAMLIRSRRTKLTSMADPRADR
jgi:hypothetical protein